MKIALVTGASSGMGREFARQLCRGGTEFTELWAVARRKEPLINLKKELDSDGRRVRVLPLDLTDQKDREKLSELLKREKPCIQVLVNAAGAGTQKKTEDCSLEELERTTELNCTAVTAAARICLPYCGPGGRIFFLASAAAFLPQPGFGAYAASKAYVLSFARAFRREVKSRGIGVTILCPGPVDTPFLESMGGKERMPAYKKRFIASPKDVVEKGIQDGARGRELSVYGFSIKALRAAAKLLPASLLLKFVKQEEDS